MQLYFQMRSWSVDGGILLKSLATTLAFWFAGVSEILMMKLEELHRCPSRKASKRTHQGPEQFLYSGFLKVQRDLNNLSHIKKRAKKKKYWHIYIGLQSRIGKTFHVEKWAEKLWNTSGGKGHDLSIEAALKSATFINTNNDGDMQH